MIWEILLRAIITGVLTVVIHWLCTYLDHPLPWLICFVIALAIALGDLLLALVVYISNS